MEETVVSLQEAGTHVPRTTGGRYVAVNALWPQELPPMTADQAVRVFRVLYRHRMACTWTNRVIAVRGRRRRTWTNGSTMIVAPDQGWRHFIHDLSHWIHRRQFPGQNPHRGSSHAAVEKDLIEEVLRRGWLNEEPKVKALPPKPKIDLRKKRYERVLRRIKEWTTRSKRAETTLKTLAKRKAYYERGMRS